MRGEILRIVGFAAWAAIAMAQAQAPEIDIYLEDGQSIPPIILAKAEATTTRIFAAIDIKVNCHVGSERKGAETAISLKIDNEEPSESHPGALGFSTPYAVSGTRIHVLFDRVRSGKTPNVAGPLLGHVMAHEIAHVLEGYASHSGVGIMKPYWDNSDFAKMALHPLSFSPADVEAIRAGVARMSAHSVPGQSPR